MAVNAISNLVALNPATNTFMNVLGYYTPGDWGGGDFYWDSASTETANNGTIFVSTYSGITTGRWKRLYQGMINVRWFGAKGDDTEPASGETNTQRIQRALNMNLELYFPPGIYRITSGLTCGTPVTPSLEDGMPIIME